MAVTYNNEHMFSYIKGMASGLQWKDTLNALYIARDAHKEQVRKSGEPYIAHPLEVACHLISMGVREDAVIATALLHDYKEDCEGNLDELPCSRDVKHAIDLVSFDKSYFKEEMGIEDKHEMLKIHYLGIQNDKIATLVKLADRCNNVSTMAGVFTRAKLEEYIAETRNFVLPLVKTGKEHWPQYSDQFFILKYHIISVVDAIEATMNIK